MLDQERGDDHPHAIVHPAGVPELAHAGIDDGIAGPAALPGAQRLGVRLPGKGVERAAAGCASARSGLSNSRWRQNSRQPSSLRNLSVSAASAGARPRQSARACQTWRGLISPKRRCGDRREVPSRSGRSRVAGIAGEAIGEKPSGAAAPALRPASRSRAGRRPSRAARLERPALERARSRCRDRSRAFGAGSGAGGLAQRLQPAPERREDPQAAAFLVADVAGWAEQVAGENFRVDAEPLRAPASTDLAIAMMRRLRDLVPEHRAGFGFARDLRNDLAAGPVAAPAGRRPLAGSPASAQRLRQPPARRAAERRAHRGFVSSNT